MEQNKERWQKTVNHISSKRIRLFNQKRFRIRCDHKDLSYNIFTIALLMPMTMVLTSQFELITWNISAILFLGIGLATVTALKCCWIERGSVPGYANGLSQEYRTIDNSDRTYACNYKRIYSYLDNLLGVQNINDVLSDIKEIELLTEKNRRLKKRFCQNINLMENIYNFIRNVNDELNIMDNCHSLNDAGKEAIEKDIREQFQLIKEWAAYNLNWYSKIKKLSIKKKLEKFRVSLNKLKKERVQDADSETTIKILNNCIIEMEDSHLDNTNTEILTEMKLWKRNTERHKSKGLSAYELEVMDNYAKLIRKIHEVYDSIHFVEAEEAMLCKEAKIILKIMICES